MTVETAANFLGIPGEFTDRKKSRYVVLPIPYERTTTYRKGTADGPDAILEASAQVELFDDELRQETYTRGVHTLALPHPTLSAVEPEELPEILEEYPHRVGKSQTLYSLGGEHSISYGLVKGYKAIYPDLTVLQIDAHADMREEYEGSKFNHACVMARIVTECPAVQVGVRSFCADEAPRLDKKPLRTFFGSSKLDAKKTAKEVLASLSKHVYVTIDLDGMDPAAMPAVGTPEPGGLTWYELLTILRPVFTKKRVVGVDLNELCPIEGENVSQFTAAKLAYRLMGYETKRR
ncbi:MAG: agmatinase [Planctomycetota bacterium]